MIGCAPAIAGPDPSVSQRTRAAVSSPRRRPMPQDQVLRNQSVGSSAEAAASGPRLMASIRIRMSSAPALAYSTKTSK